LRRFDGKTVLHAEIESSAAPTTSNAIAMGRSKNIRQDPIRVRRLLLTPISSQAVISAT
jgi:hypothetical protein